MFLQYRFAYESGEVEAASIEVASSSGSSTAGRTHSCSYQKVKEKEMLTCR
jgi:hypothetical protein